MFSSFNLLSSMITDLLTIGSKPRVNINAHPNDQLYGNEITVTADVMGLTVASYQWLKDDINLSSTAKYPAYVGLGTNKLTISSFTHDYEGSYQCAVSISSGETVKSNHIELALGKLVYTFERGGDMWHISENLHHVY